MPIIKKHQTLLDFIAQHGGNVNALFNMALLNGISASSSPAPGTVLQVNEQTESSDRKVTEYFQDNGLDIAGALSVGPEILGGIGYMQIENDFIVS